MTSPMREVTTITTLFEIGSNAQWLDHVYVPDESSYPATGLETHANTTAAMAVFYKMADQLCGILDDGDER
jgi:hypothetical protein